MIEGLDGGEGLEVAPLLDAVVVQEKQPQTLETHQVFFGREQNNVIKGEIKLNQLRHSSQMVQVRCQMIVLEKRHLK